jgi:hypothetical protein
MIVKLELAGAGGYTRVPNDVLNDDRLSSSDLGLLCYLLGKPPSWWVSIKAIAASGRFGAHGKVCAALQRLRILGYAHLQRFGDGRTEWTITAKPEPDSQNRIVDEEPHSENPHLDFRNGIERKNVTNERSSTPAPAARARDEIREQQEPPPDPGLIPVSDWPEPSVDCMGALIRMGVPEEFITEALPEFRLYWTDRRTRKPGWDAPFFSHVFRAWKKHQAAPPPQRSETPKRGRRLTYAEFTAIDFL